MKSSNSIRARMSSISSVDELYSTATVIGQNMVRCCRELAQEMEACQNDDAGRAFLEIADRESAHVDLVCEQAKKAGAKIGVDVDDAWNLQNLRGSLAREIADNPYLITPYRAYQLAVINAERVFEILSTLVAMQEDDVISQHAEILAHGQLSEIAAFRLCRLRASRSEVKTAIGKENLHAIPVRIDNLNLVVRTVHAIIRTMIVTVCDTWALEMSNETKFVLQKLLNDFQDFPDSLVQEQDRAALDARVKLENGDLLSALKSLMREFESAVDLFLGYAENAKSEEVVNAAQAEAERYVHRIAKIRDELKQRLLD